MLLSRFFRCLAACRGPRIASLLVVCLVGALAACNHGSPSESPTQIAAKVNDREISLPQLDLMLQRQGIRSREQSAELARRVLDSIVDEELAAGAARKAGLDQDPRVVQSIEAAKREILARAYQDSVAQKAPLVSTDEMERYYDSQPALFAQRRLFSLQELNIQGNTSQLMDLKPRIEAATSAQQVTELLNVANLAFTVRDLSVSPEDIPLALLDRLGSLSEGHSLMLAQPQGARALTVIAAKPAPVGRDVARKSIGAFLANEHKRQYVGQAIVALRAGATIEYKGSFATAASAAASGAASQPASP